MTGYTSCWKSYRDASTTIFTTAVLAVSLAGCAASTSASPDAGPPVQDSGGPPPADAGADTAMQPASDSGSGQDSAAAALALPFYVSDQFIPSGFMNDPMGISLSTGSNGSAACPTRAPGAGGDCYVVGWNSTGAMWAGVYWQYPANNWGTEPGLMIAPSAKQVSFQAQGAAGGEVVTFKSGGLNDPLSASAGSFGDSFSAAAPVVTLTTTWTKYTISLQGASYPTGVLGAFVWVAAATTTGSNNKIKFYVDDVQWE